MLIEYPANPGGDGEADVSRTSAPGNKSPDSVGAWGILISNRHPRGKARVSSLWLGADAQSSRSAIPRICKKTLTVSVSAAGVDSASWIFRSVSVPTKRQANSRRALGFVQRRRYVRLVVETVMLWNSVVRNPVNPISMRISGRRQGSCVAAAQLGEHRSVGHVSTDP